MKKIKIDILMTVHNGEKFLEQTINSLKSQKYKNWELIIVNNCSTDRTPKLLNRIKYNSKKIRVFDTNRLLTRPEVLNWGLKHCNNDYIGILDADDLVSPDWLENVRKIIIANQDFGALVGNYTPINEENKILKKKKLFKCKQGVINNIFLYTFPCAHSGSIFSSKVINKFNKPYDEKLKTGHDWRLFLRISFLNKILFVDKNWIYWRRYKQSSTALSQISSKLDIIKNLLYAKRSKLSLANLFKNNFMILIQFYHLSKIFFFKKKMFYFFFALSFLLILPLLLYSKKNFLIKSFIKKVNEKNFRF